jgi:glucose-6-phosphate 1-epimerase
MFQNTQHNAPFEIKSGMRDALSVLSVHYGDNMFRVTPFGGQLIAWEKQGVPILFENTEAACCDGKTAYRGGAPICAPYFGKGLLLPKQTALEPQHGNARKSTWQIETSPQQKTITCTTIQDVPAIYGEQKLLIKAQYDFSTNHDLMITCTIKNLGTSTIPVQYVLHSYWYCKDPASTVITGLGSNYHDNLDNLSPKQHQAPLPQQHTPPFDRIYTNPSQQLTLTTEQYHLTITTSQTNGAVLWNPGTAHGLKDLKDPTFVCVESGIIAPAPNLNPDEEYTFTVSYDATPLSS